MMSISPGRGWGKLAALLALSACASPGPAGSPAPEPRGSDGATYWVYVGAESADMIHQLSFGPDGAAVRRSTLVGESPVEMEGPHGLAVSRDGFLHLTTGHGSPDGKYWRYVAGVDTLTAPGTFLGYFPASLDVTPDGLYAFVVNFNLHGRMEPSSVSVVYTPTSTEVARTTTCTMPHGSRLDPRGRWHYSACMMDDQLVEIDAASFAVHRRFSVAKGAEGPLAPDDLGHGAHAGGGTMPPASCSPTWARSPCSSCSPRRPRACSTASWTRSRR